MKDVNPPRKVLIRNEPRPPGPLTPGDILLVLLTMIAIAVVAVYLASQVGSNFDHDPMAPDLPAAKGPPQTHAIDSTQGLPAKSGGADSHEVLSDFDFATAASQDTRSKAISDTGWKIVASNSLQLIDSIQLNDSGSTTRKK